MAKGERFDLVFMDIQMPNLDGIQSTKLIREMGFSAPIVALTAFAEESNMKECMESGMDFFLPKPIRRPALKQVLKRFTTIPEEDGDSAATNGTNNTTKKEIYPVANQSQTTPNAGIAEESTFSNPKKTVHTIQDSELDSSNISPMS
jgi:osomolarity two-component system, sensor histidine kinase SLN1